MPKVSNQQKENVWQAYRGRKPTRVPVTFGVNSRVVILDPKWNDGISFQDAFGNPLAAIEVQRKCLRYTREYLHNYCDSPTGMPTEWSFGVDTQNVYDAAYFGCPVMFRDNQVPDTEPILTGDNKQLVFQMDIDHPLENQFVKSLLARHEAIKSELSKQSVYDGVQFKITPLTLGFDGPLTIATQLRGMELYCDIIEDPDYVVRLMSFITQAVMIRNQALCRLAGLDYFAGNSPWFADDSVQLISTEMYKELVLPLHREFYSHWKPPHMIHLCGDATRHFPTIQKELGVFSFDTGFPVDHGRLRKNLGNDVEIFGGPEVALLAGGKPSEVYERTKSILQSGVMQGGRFILREANNLPPCVPEANLSAMYQCCLDNGNYE